MATHRKRKNFIKGIKDVHGEWVTDEEAVSSIFVDFYSRLFTTSCPIDLERVLEGVQPVVSESMNEVLTRPYVREEVDVAIKQIAPLKAPGLDSIPPLFFQTFWSDIGLDVSESMLSCLNSRTILKSINHTFLTLIPKVKNPETIA